jgi:hypothetical protein
MHGIAPTKLIAKKTRNKYTIAPIAHILAHQKTGTNEVRNSSNPSQTVQDLRSGQLEKQALYT